MRQIAFLLLPVAALAQTPPPPLQQPWEGVPEAYRSLPIGKLEAPATLAAWNEQRAKVKSIVLSSLGELPPRPKPLKVSTLETRKHDGYTVEKFVFHNGVGYYANDLIQNDPWLRGDTVMLLSGWPRAETTLLQRYFPGEYVARSNRYGTSYTQLA